LIVRSELDAEQREWLREWSATEEEGEQES
jgi:hypothetical protein